MQTQTAHILINQYGILLGIYRNLEVAKKAIKHYQTEETTTCPKLFLYSATSDQVNTTPRNQFPCVWESDNSYF